ncbi:hypothetical protein LTR04_002147, partial [Oleoguttula sp. CCFEE 6159]
KPLEDNYYRAIYLVQRTVKELVNRLAVKCNIDPTQVLQTVRVNRSGLNSVFNDESVRKLTEGQDLVAEFTETKLHASARHEWDAGLTDVQADGNVGGIENVNLAKYAGNQALSSSTLTSWYAFDRWYKKSDETAVYAAALILDPQRKTQYIKKNWKRQWIQPTTDAVQILWETQYKDRIETALAETSEVSQELDEFDLVKRQLDFTVSVLDEYED